MTPNIQEKYCSKYFKFRDFFECGETQQQTKIKNYPQDPRTLSAIEQLAQTVLDPIVDQFGQIKITYGFSSNELSLQIKNKPKPGISPKIDQHAGYEKNSRDNLICKRPGFACDFYSINTDSLTVTKWIVNNLEFDRIYFYGKKRPIHISTGPELHSVITLIEKLASGRRIPRNIKKEEFLLKK